MSNNNKNIDGLFQDSFAGYEVKPSSKVWYKVQHGVLPAKILFLYKNSFSGYQQASGSAIWSVVNARLAWYRFWFFNPYSVNVYYVVAAIAIASSTLWLTGAFTSSSKNGELPQYAIAERINTIENFRTVNLEKLAANNIQTERLTQEVFAINTMRAEVGPENISAQNNAIIPLTHDLNNWEEVATVTDINAHDAIATTENLENIVEPALPFVSNKPSVFERHYFSKLNFRVLKPRFNPDPNIWSTLAISQGTRPTLTPTPIVPDTLGTNYKGEPIIVAAKYISFEPNYAGFYSFDRLFTTQPEIGITGESLVFSQNYSQFYGLHVALQSRHLRVLSGLGYSITSESYHQIFTENKIQTSFEYIPFNFQDWQRDTTWLLDLDAWLHGDTTYFPFVDSSLVNLTDSSLQIVYDTIYMKDTALYNNRYTYFEVPLIAGYSFHLKNWSITPQTGFVFGFLSSSSGSYPVSREQSFAISELYPMRPMVVSWYAGLNLRYYFMKNVGVMAEPWFTRTLTPLYHDDAHVNRNQMRVGLRLGLSIRI